MVPSLVEHCPLYEDTVGLKTHEHLGIRASLDQLVRVCARLNEHGAPLPDAWRSRGCVNRVIQFVRRRIRRERGGSIQRVAASSPERSVGTNRSDVSTSTGARP